MIFDLASWRASLTPEQPALHWRGRWYTYAELDERAEKLAARLHAEGVRQGDRVAILAFNHVAHVDLVLAAPKLGFIYAPFNYRLAVNEQKDIARLLEPAFLFHDRANEEKAQATGCKRLLLERYADWLAKAAPAIEAPALSPDDTHMILLTGGSTGLPKGAQIPYRQVFSNAMATAAAWGLSDKDCAIQATPAFHAGLNVLATPLWYQGGRVVWTETFDVVEYLERVTDTGATILFMVPTMFQMLAEHSHFAGADFSRVRFAITGGAPCPAGVAYTFAGRGVHFRLGYGLTECGVNCFAISSEEAERYPASVGRPIPGLAAVIRRPDGSEVVPEELGELTFSGPAVFTGYFRKPAETALALRDGWLWTGDLARRDEHGLHYICGRRKEMYISGGENVYPIEIEAAVSRCRGVAECAVIGVPHPRWGETGLAAIVAREGAKLTSDNVRNELKAHLAGYKLPGEFLFLKELPKTGAGKIDKIAIRALYDAQSPARMRGGS